MAFIEIPTFLATQLKMIGTLGAAAIGTVAINRKLTQSTVHGRLRSVCEACKLYTEKTNLLGKKYHVYPQVKSTTYGTDGITLVFSIPFGVNPESVEKATWAFRQQFGDGAELSRVGQRFTLTTVKRGIPNEVPYNVQEISVVTQGMRIPIVVGRSDSVYEAYDMAEFPHLLIAGETGSGKSTQMRAILTYLITNKSSDDVRLILADMKRSEFHLFRNVIHVQSVVTAKAALLRQLIGVDQELARRGDLLDEYEVSHIDEYNELNGVEKEPYIIVAIDEVSLLQKEKEAMRIIEDISAIGRALGVFLILSMQRPDSKVLDGKLKNNLTVRMAFRHSDEINSRITINVGDAADIRITERGRMIYKRESLITAQGPYLSLDETKRILAPHKVTKRRSYASTDAFDMEGEIKSEDIREDTVPIFGLLNGGDRDASTR